MKGSESSLHQLIHIREAYLGYDLLLLTKKCRGDQTGRPYIRVVNVPELRFDKMSNEGVYNVLPHTKIRFGGFRGILRRFAKRRWMQFAPERDAFVAVGADWISAGRVKVENAAQKNSLQKCVPAYKLEVN